MFIIMPLRRLRGCDLIGDDCNLAAAAPDINASSQRSDSGIEQLLQLFLDQAWPIRSILAVGFNQLYGQVDRDSAAAIDGHNEAFLFRLAADGNSIPKIVSRIPLRQSRCRPGGAHAYTLDSLARQARELSSDSSGNDLLLSPTHTLTKIMSPLADEFSFRAVAAVLSPLSGRPHEDSWKVRRSLFDRGLICIGSVQVAGCQALCFLASNAVRVLQRCDVGSRGHVTMSELANKCGFANQLFRYAYVKLYALRHGLTAAFPEWQGNQLFNLDDESCAGLNFGRLSFNGFTDRDRLLWEKDDPPIDIDLYGYFQEIPACWQRHRPLLRRLFALRPEHQDTIDSWRHDATRGGQRTLVAIHVRRGDYRKLQLLDAPWFRLVPEGWYVNWLQTIWPTLRDPLLFVATDEPDAILPVFREFEVVSAKFGATTQALPEYVRDFEILRRADYLAICNSSFSRMAAILAPPTQKSFLPSFQAQCFAPYEPWRDPAFWARFADAWCRPITERHQDSAPTRSSKHASDAPTQPSIYFDITDLVLYLVNHTTLSGIQRVQCEILRHLRDICDPQVIRFAVLNDVSGLSEVDASALLNIFENNGSDARSTADTVSELHALCSRARPCGIRPRDIFLTIGAFWTVTGMGVLLQKLKNAGVIIGVFIHDIIPITAPEYFEARDTRVFVKGVVEALTFADFILTSSEYNKTSLLEHMATHRMEPLPVHLVPPAHQLANKSQIEANVSDAVAAIIDTDYVLCVGTIEVRKNPTYLFNIWKLMVRSGRANVPTLVFVGRKGWLVQDLMNQLKVCNYLDGRIVLLHDVTDAELDLLYRKCMLTAFPSFVEGWGLPVGESLAHGKITICSAVGGIPEVGGELLDYIDPYNACGALELMLRYVDDPALRRSREEEIGHYFKPRCWRQVANDFLKSVHALTRQVRPYEGVAAINLPPGRFLPISADPAAISMDAIDGALSAELACISGWHAPQVWGVQAARPETTLRFRADAPVGTRINLVMRLAVRGQGRCRIRISSGSGAETEASVKGGSDSVAVLSCEIEPGQLITVRLLLARSFLDTEFADPPYWSLKGLLYFGPERLTRQASKDVTSDRGPLSRSTEPLASTSPREQPDPTQRASLARRILLPPTAPWEDRQCATSFGAFLQAADSYWGSEFANNRDAPIFADHLDKQIFYSGCGNHALAPRVGEITDSIKLIRRSNQFVSMSRFTEGSIFDRSGVWRALGYLQTSPPTFAPWLSNGADGLWVDADTLTTAPRYESSYLIFYNGNLHNYYHWMVEGLLSLDLLSRALGPDSRLKVALPKSMEIAEMFDHRESLRAVGFDQYDIVEVAANLIKVQEAIWVDSDLIQSMPAPYLKDFQQRVAARYKGLCSPPRRRLLVARKGPTRTIHNLEQVQSVLSMHGFETVYLEGMSIIDQILLFQSAEFVISPHGAGLANLLFCEPGTKVIEFMPTVGLRPFFWLISEKLDLIHGMQFCTPVGHQDFQAAITVDIGKLQALFSMVDAHL